MPSGRKKCALSAMTATETFIDSRRWLAADRGGLWGEALAVREMPTSGTSDELLDAAGISARHIAAAARSIAKGT